MDIECCLNLLGVFVFVDLNVIIIYFLLYVGSSDCVLYVVF